MQIFYCPLFENEYLKTNNMKWKKSYTFKINHDIPSSTLPRISRFILSFLIIWPVEWCLCCLNWCWSLFNQHFGGSDWWSLLFYSSLSSRILILRWSKDRLHRSTRLKRWFSCIFSIGNDGFLVFWVQPSFIFHFAFWILGICIGTNWKIHHRWSWWRDKVHSKKYWHSIFHAKGSISSRVTQFSINLEPI